MKEFIICSHVLICSFEHKKDCPHGGGHLPMEWSDNHPESCRDNPVTCLNVEDEVICGEMDHHDES